MMIVLETDSENQDNHENSIDFIATTPSKQKWSSKLRET